MLTNWGNAFGMNMTASVFASDVATVGIIWAVTLPSVGGLDLMSCSTVVDI